MRKIVLFGATAIVLTLGAADASAMGSGNLSPQASPYAILEPQTAPPSAIDEGRAAYIGGEMGDKSGFDAARAGYGPTVTRPEDETYYSRGR